jgi:hypothetical protein
MLAATLLVALLMAQTNGIDAQSSSGSVGSVPVPPTTAVPIPTTKQIDRSKVIDRIYIRTDWNITVEDVIGNLQVEMEAVLRAMLPAELQSLDPAPGLLYATRVTYAGQQDWAQLDFRDYLSSSTNEARARLIERIRFGDRQLASFHITAVFWLYAGQLFTDPPTPTWSPMEGSIDETGNRNVLIAGATIFAVLLFGGAIAWIGRRQAYVYGVHPVFQARATAFSPPKAVTSGPIPPSQGQWTNHASPPPPGATAPSANAGPLALDGPPLPMGPPPPTAPVQHSDTGYYPPPGAGHPNAQQWQPPQQQASPLQSYPPNQPGFSAQYQGHDQANYGSGNQGFTMTTGGSTRELVL